MHKILLFVSILQLGFILSFSYDLGAPGKIYNLPKELIEVSGIVSLNENEIGCIQDETGIFYTYSFSESKITGQVKFADKGDFEDVTIVGDKVYVLESRGKLYCFTPNKGTPAIKVFNIQIQGERDAESLCYDPKNNRLLFTFKVPGKKSRIMNIYAFDLASEKVLSQPALSFQASNLNDFVKGNKRISKKLEKGWDIAPSALGIHPLSGSIFFLSAQNSILITTNPAGKIENTYILDPKIFLQPEGITFAENGDMYISNEGNKKSGATILKFAYVH